MNARNQSPGVDGSVRDDLRRLRLGLGLTLLRDGQYFGFDRARLLAWSIVVVQEYDADLGTRWAVPNRPFMATATQPRL